MGVSESGSTRSLAKALDGMALGGSAGRDFSVIMGEWSFSLDLAAAAAFDFFLRLAIRVSWHPMQNMPCEVLAYRRFSIFRLQFRHRKQVAQKAWSPVRMARSSILLPQALQLYVQLLHMRDPSPRSRRLASESRRVPQVLQRKQSRCHRLPAIKKVSASHSGWVIRGNGGRVTQGLPAGRARKTPEGRVKAAARPHVAPTYLIRTLCPPRGSTPDGTCQLSAHVCCRG